METKKEQIIDAALAEFRDSGFAGASMDRIAARANVSKRTVYNHFESKEALFRAIIQLLMEQVATALDVDFDPKVSVRDQLVGLGRAEGRLLMSETFMSLAAIVIGEAIRDHALATEFHCRMENVDHVRRFIESAATHGAIRVDDAGEAADQFIGLIKAQAFWPALLSGQRVTEDAMENIVQTSVSMFLARYGADDASD